jgi:DNA transposition AAA+ family ATPase
MAETTESVKRPAFCMTPTAQKIVGIADFCAAGEMGVLSGEPGVGKTTALAAVVERLAGARMVTLSPARKSVSAAMALICEGLGGPVGRRPTADSREYVCNFVGYGSIELIILDECQHCDDETLEELRSIHDETGVGLLFCGNARFRRAVSIVREDFGQFTSRVGMRLAIKQPERGDVEAICDSLGILEGKARGLLIRQAVQRGGLRRAFKLIGLAEKAAGAPGAIREEHLAMAQRVVGLDS